MQINQQTNEIITLGIDLGTTFSSISTCYNRNQIETYKLKMNEQSIPTLISFQKTEKGNIEANFKTSETDGESNKIISNVKRLLGKTYKEYQEMNENEKKFFPFIVKSDCFGNVTLKPKLEGFVDEFYPEEIAGIIIGYLLENVKRVNPNKEIGIVTVAVPTECSERQKEATIRACQIAGLKRKNVMLFEEPTASILGYCRLYQNTIEDKGKVIVIDFGGGTLDICVCSVENVDKIVNGESNDENEQKEQQPPLLKRLTNRIRGRNNSNDNDNNENKNDGNIKHIKVIGKKGDSNFGGNTFDLIIADMIIQQMKDYEIDEEIIKMFEENDNNENIDESNEIDRNSKFRKQLLKMAVEIKKELDSSDQVLRTLRDLLGDLVDHPHYKIQDDDIVITREEFEQAAMHKLQEFEQLINQTLINAEIQIKDIQLVLPIGGTCKIPCVREKIREIFPRPIAIGNQEFNPLYAVVEGCAFRAYQLQNKQEQIVTEKVDYDIVFKATVNNKPYDMVIFEKFSQIPNETQFTIGLPDNNENKMFVKLYKRFDNLDERNGKYKWFDTLIFQYSDDIKAGTKLTLLFKINDCEMLDVSLVTIDGSKELAHVKMIVQNRTINGDQIVQVGQLKILKYEKNNPNRNIEQRYGRQINTVELHESRTPIAIHVGDEFSCATMIENHELNQSIPKEKLPQVEQDDSFLNQIREIYQPKFKTIEQSSKIEIKFKNNENKQIHSLNDIIRLVDQCYTFPQQDQMELKIGEYYYNYLYDLIETLLDKKIEIQPNVAVIIPKSMSVNQIMKIYETVESNKFSLFEILFDSTAITYSIFKNNWIQCDSFNPTNIVIIDVQDNYTSYHICQLQFPNIIKTILSEQYHFLGYHKIIDMMTERIFKQIETEQTIITFGSLSEKTRNNCKRKLWNEIHKIVKDFDEIDKNKTPENWKIDLRVIFPEESGEIIISQEDIKTHFNYYSAIFKEQINAPLGQPALIRKNNIKKAFLIGEYINSNFIVSCMNKIFPNIFELHEEKEMKHIASKGGCLFIEDCRRLLCDAHCSIFNELNTHIIHLHK